MVARRLPRETTHKDRRITIMLQPIITVQDLQINKTAYKEPMLLNLEAGRAQVDKMLAWALVVPLQ